MTPDTFLKSLQEYYGVKYNPMQLNTNKKWLLSEGCGEMTLRTLYKQIVENVEVGYNNVPSIQHFKKYLQFIRSNPELIEYKPMLQDKTEVDPTFWEAIATVAKKMKRGIMGYDPKEDFEKITGVKIIEGEE